MREPTRPPAGSVKPPPPRARPERRAQWVDDFVRRLLDFEFAPPIIESQVRRLLSGDLAVSFVYRPEEKPEP